MAQGHRTTAMTMDGMRKTSDEEMRGMMRKKGSTGEVSFYLTNYSFYMFLGTSHDDDNKHVGTMDGRWGQ